MGISDVFLTVVVGVVVGLTVRSMRRDYQIAKARGTIMFGFVPSELSIRDGFNALRREYQALRHARKLRVLKLRETSDGNDGFLIGYRYAHMVVHEEHPYFLSLYYESIFGQTSEAECRHVRAVLDHKAPKESCTCGYYSLLDPTVLPRVSLPEGFAGVNLYLLQVRLSGVIIEGERGWRAERQDVLKVWLPSRCAVCNREATMLASHYEIGRSPYTAQNDFSLIPMCDSHGANSGWRFTIAELRQKLGVECDWISSIK